MGCRPTLVERYKSLWLGVNSLQLFSVSRWVWANDCEVICLQSLALSQWLWTVGCEPMGPLTGDSHWLAAFDSESSAGSPWLRADGSELFAAAKGHWCARQELWGNVSEPFAHSQRLHTYGSEPLASRQPLRAVTQWLWANGNQLFILVEREK